MNRNDMNSNDGQSEIGPVMHRVWFWDCDECGVENVDRSFESPISKELAEALRATNVVLGDHTVVETTPTRVECSVCGKAYNAHPFI